MNILDFINSSLFNALNSNVKMLLIVGGVLVAFGILLLIVFFKPDKKRFRDFETYEFEEEKKNNKIEKSLKPVVESREEKEVKEENDTLNKVVQKDSTIEKKLDTFKSSKKEDINNQVAIKFSTSDDEHAITLEKINVDKPVVSKKVNEIYHDMSVEKAIVLSTNDDENAITIEKIKIDNPSKVKEFKKIEKEVNNLVGERAIIVSERADEHAITLEKIKIDGSNQDKNLKKIEKKLNGIIGGRAIEISNSDDEHAITLEKIKIEDKPVLKKKPVISKINPINEKDLDITVPISIIKEEDIKFPEEEEFEEVAISFATDDDEHAITLEKIKTDDVRKDNDESVSEKMEEVAMSFATLDDDKTLEEEDDIEFL